MLREMSVWPSYSKGLSVAQLYWLGIELSPTVGRSSDVTFIRVPLQAFGSPI